jgi:hypothetical protein
MWRASPCSSLLLWWSDLPAGYFCRFCLVKVHVESRSLPLSLSLVCSKHPACPLCCVSFSVPCLLFRGFFWCGRDQSVQGLCWFIPGVAVGVPYATYFLTCWSVSPKWIWSQCLVAQEPSWFLSVTWYGEALCGPGARGVGVLLILDGFFLPSVAPVSQQDF